jgi:hypothetical protein
MEDAGVDEKTILKRRSSADSMLVCGLNSDISLQEKNEWLDLLSIVINIRVTLVSGKSLASSANVRLTETPPYGVVTYAPLYYIFFIFFFHWHYSPLWALACRTRSFHFFLSVTNSLHHR